MTMEMIWKFEDRAELFDRLIKDQKYLQEEYMYSREIEAEVLRVQAYLKENDIIPTFHVETCAIHRGRYGAVHSFQLEKDLIVYYSGPALALEASVNKIHIGLEPLVFLSETLGTKAFIAAAIDYRGPAAAFYAQENPAQYSLAQWAVRQAYQYNLSEMENDIEILSKIFGLSNVIKEQLQVTKRLVEKADTTTQIAYCLATGKTRRELKQWAKG